MCYSDPDFAEHFEGLPELFQIEHFEVLEQLGGGRYAEVWRCRDHQLERDVAIKYLRPTQGLSSALDHARALARAEHPNGIRSTNRVLDNAHVGRTAGRCGSMAGWTGAAAVSGRIAA